MKRAYIMVGIVGSGKSTWAKNKVNETEDRNICIISLDNIREMLFGKYIYDKNKEDLVKKVAWGSIQQAFSCGYDVIIDSCNITKIKRQQWVDFIKLHYGNDIEIIFVVCPEKENNLENRKKDLRGYKEEKWKTIIDDMKKDYENVTGNEGHSKIIENKIS
jgi:predicted kinase